MSEIKPDENEDVLMQKGKVVETEMRFFFNKGDGMMRRDYRKEQE